jgi:hypothetical protein
MEEAPENGKESLHSARPNGMNNKALLMGLFNTSSVRLTQRTQIVLLFACLCFYVRWKLQF